MNPVNFTEDYCIFNNILLQGGNGESNGRGKKTSRIRDLIQEGTLSITLTNWKEQGTTVILITCPSAPVFVDCYCRWCYIFVCHFVDLFISPHQVGVPCSFQFEYTVSFTGFCRQNCWEYFSVKCGVILYGVQAENGTLSFRKRQYRNATIHLWTRHRIPN